MDAVNAEAAAEGSVVHVCVASTGVEAARLANAFADELVRQRSSLFNRAPADDPVVASTAGGRAGDPTRPAARVRRREASRRVADLRGSRRPDPAHRRDRHGPHRAGPEDRSRSLAIGLPIALLLGGATALLHAALRRPVPDTSPADDAADRPQDEQLEQERRLKERIEAVTAREVELARRAQVTLRERELDAERPPEPEPEPEPEREPEPDPEPEPAPPAPSHLGRNLVTLEHAVSARERELPPGRREELHSYLAYLRPYAEPDGTLPELVRSAGRRDLRRPPAA